MDNTLNAYTIGLNTNPFNKNHANSRHYHFIETQVLWRGKINSTDIAQQFNIAKPTAKKLLQNYQNKYPKQLTYCSSSKAYLADSTFQPNYTNGHLIEYANWQKAYFYQLNGDQNLPYFSQIPLPQHYINPKLFQNLYQAVINKNRIEVDYISLASTDYDGRIIAPHHFVYDGNRWHVRAYDEKRQTFLDFNLSRFQGAGEIENDYPQTSQTNSLNPADPQQDLEWQTQVEVILKPDPRLSPAQTKCIETEYQMTNGQLILHSKAALVKYVLLRLRVDIYQPTAEAQQIILDPECRKKLLQYLPKS